MQPRSSACAKGSIRDARSIPCGGVHAQLGSFMVKIEWLRRVASILQSWSGIISYPAVSWERFKENTLHHSRADKLLHFHWMTLSFATCSYFVLEFHESEVWSKQATGIACFTMFYHVLPMKSIIWHVCWIEPHVLSVLSSVSGSVLLGPR